MSMIATINHRVLNAYRFLNDGDTWLILGGQDPWTDDQNPPTPDANTLSILTPIGAKKATKQLVVQDDINGTEQFLLNGTITRWKIMSDLDDAVANEARWILIRGIIVGDEVPLTTFREIGFVSNLEHTVLGTPSTLLPTDISDYGNLESVEYKKPVARDISTGYEIAAIIEL